MKLCSDIYGPQRIKPNDFGDSLTSYPAQTFNMFCTLVNLSIVLCVFNKQAGITVESC